MKFIIIPRPLLLLLSFIGGWTDVATFVGLDYLLSGHITGNIVVFAALAVDGVSASDTLKIIMIPVFFTAVFLITRIHDAGFQKSPDHTLMPLILILEAVLLIVGGLSAYVLPVYWPGIRGFWFDAHVATVIVMAMAFQNAAHRLYSLGAPTTVMTGNVTQFGIDLARIRSLNDKMPEAGLPMQILVFAGGCILSAYLTHLYGVVTVVVPGVLLLLVCLTGGAHIKVTLS